MVPTHLILRVLGSLAPRVLVAGASRTLQNMGHVCELSRPGLGGAIVPDAVPVLRLNPIPLPGGIILLTQA